MADERLHPTPTRLALLDDAIADQLLGPSARVDEMRAAGWIEPYPPPSSRYRATAYGRAIRDVRILDFGPHLVVAETGDGDEPRYLGGAVPGAGRTWLVQVAGQNESTTCRSKHAAKEELRHMAASLLAAEQTSPTVQEGQS